jgi:hypothetical protein
LGVGDVFPLPGRHRQPFSPFSSAERCERPKGYMRKKGLRTRKAKAWRNVP